VFAVAAVIVFILGLILNLLGVGFNWVLLFLGLALLAVHLVWSWTPWERRS
jgi:ribose/xylose/arabinose/galactoside ABC-type transport system permease subunit